MQFDIHDKKNYSDSKILKFGHQFFRRKYAENIMSGHFPIARSYVIASRAVACTTPEKLTKTIRKGPPGKSRLISYWKKPSRQISMNMS